MTTNRQTIQMKVIRKLISLRFLCCSSCLARLTVPGKCRKLFTFLIGIFVPDEQFLSVTMNSQSQFRFYPYAHISSCYEIKQLWLFGHISIYRNMTFVIPLLLCHSKRSSKPISKIWPYLLCYFVPNTCIISWNYKFGRINKIQGYDWMVLHL